MRRIQTSTLALLTLLVGLVATLVALALRRAGGAEAPIGHQVNDLIATFEIALPASPGSVRAIPGWATLIALVGGTAGVGARLLAQRNRNRRS